MAKGPSGRIIIDIDPAIKHELYEVLDSEGLNMKQWFLENATKFLQYRTQPKLDLNFKTETDQQ